MVRLTLHVHVGEPTLLCMVVERASRPSFCIFKWDERLARHSSSGARIALTFK
ncbi:MAG TPA: hypothetical protein VG711_05130 [Phycisphaerales bacterium]|nr:hypothetical protein [Phycisphaerales bacterium]